MSISASLPASCPAAPRIRPRILNAAGLPPQGVLQVKEDVICGGIINDQFGTFLMFLLAWLWYVLQHAGAGLRIAFVTRGGFDPWRRHGAWLELAGIDRRRLMPVRVPTQFKSVLVPGQSLYLGEQAAGVHSEAFVAPYAAMVRRAPHGVSAAFTSRVHAMRSATCSMKVISRTSLPPGALPSFIPSSSLLPSRWAALPVPGK